MKNIVKKILIILIGLLYSTVIYGNDRIAVAGNSLAANFAWANQIDLCEKSSSMFTRHAVAGDGVNSSGFMCDVNFDGIEYFAGEGKHFVKNIIEDSFQYDMILFISGTNELMSNLTENPNYYNRENIIINEYIQVLEQYLDKINYNCKILLFTIPKVLSYTEQENNSRNKWNEAIMKLGKNYSNVYIEDFNDYELNYLDQVHFTVDSNKQLYYILKLKYNLIQIYTKIYYRIDIFKNVW